MRKTKWLSRDIGAPGPFLALCLSEKEYMATMRRLGMKYPVPWLSEAPASTHSFTNNLGQMSAVVCLRHVKGVKKIQIMALLVHEAVHVWQFYCEHIGEKEPGRETEAYAIESISQALMFDYERKK